MDLGYMLRSPCKVVDRINIDEEMRRYIHDESDLDKVVAGCIFPEETGFCTRLFLEKIYKKMSPSSIHHIGLLTQKQYLSKGAFPNPSFTYWHTDMLFPQTDCYYFLCSISDNPFGLSNTKFIRKPIANPMKIMPDFDLKTGHSFIENYIIDNSKNIMNTQDGDVIRFNGDIWHTPVPSRDDGVRLFMRANIVLNRALIQPS